MSFLGFNVCSHYESIITHLHNKPHKNVIHELCYLETVKSAFLVLNSHFFSAGAYLQLCPYIYHLIQQVFESAAGEQ